MLTAGLILAIMVLPFITSISRDVFDAVPPVLKEAAYGLGCTTWEVVRYVVLPYTRVGVIGGIMLGLGRALGETMAVTFVIGNAHRISTSILAPGTTISATIANEFTEAVGDLYTSSLIALGLILFVITAARPPHPGLHHRPLRLRRAAAGAEEQAMSEHTIKAFDTELQELVRKVAEMGGLAERQITDSVVALIRRDTAQPERVMAIDTNIDALQREIEERAILIIARRQPMAVDLREVVGALRVSNDLERIGDLAKNIAKRVVVLDGEFRPNKVIRGVEHMTDLVLAQLKQVLDSYVRRDVAMAIEVWRNDEAIDAVNNSLFRELLTYMMEDPRNITFCTHLLFCAKNIERMGDHATNIAETVHYIVEGRSLPDERPKSDLTSFARVPLRK